LSYGGAGEPVLFCWLRDLGERQQPAILHFTAGEDAPTLVLRNVDFALARETSWVDDVRIYHLHSDDLPGLVREILAEKAVRGGRIAIEVQSYALPHALGRALESALADTELVDATKLLGDLRLIKSPAEIAMLDQAGKFAGIGLEAARSALKPGITEIALAAEIEAAMRRAGSDYWAIPTELASGWRTPGGSGVSFCIHASARPSSADHLVAHDEFLRLAGDGHRQFGDDAHVARDLVVGDLAAAELADLVLAGRRAGARHDPGADLLAVLGVRHPEDLHADCTFGWVSRNSSTSRG
jgi:hypothetical protein